MVQYVKNTGTALRIGDTAPNFTCESNEGTITMHDYVKMPTPSWVLFFSHPADFSKDLVPALTTMSLSHHGFA